MYVYIRSEPQLWTVGHYDPQGRWQPESDHSTAGEAAERVAYLNGGPALNLLRRLATHDHVNLGELVYTVRERELKGWDGPAVQSWSSLITEVLATLKLPG